MGTGRIFGDPIIDGGVFMGGLLYVITGFTTLDLPLLNPVGLGFSATGLVVRRRDFPFFGDFFPFSIWLRRWPADLAFRLFLEVFLLSFLLAFGDAFPLPDLIAGTFSTGEGVD